MRQVFARLACLVIAVAALSSNTVIAQTKSSTTPLKTNKQPLEIEPGPDGGCSANMVCVTPPPTPSPTPPPGAEDAAAGMADANAALSKLYRVEIPDGGGIAQIVAPVRDDSVAVAQRTQGLNYASLLAAVSSSPRMNDYGGGDILLAGSPLAYLSIGSMNFPSLGAVKPQFELPVGNPPTALTCQGSIRRSEFSWLSLADRGGVLDQVGYCLSHPHGACTMSASFANDIAVIDQGAAGCKVVIVGGVYGAPPSPSTATLKNAFAWSSSPTGQTSTRYLHRHVGCQNGDLAYQTQCTSNQCGGESCGLRIANSAEALAISQDGSYVTGELYNSTSFPFPSKLRKEGFLWRGLFNYPIGWTGGMGGAVSATSVSDSLVIRSLRTGSGNNPVRSGDSRGAVALTGNIVSTVGSGFADPSNFGNLTALRWTALGNGRVGDSTPWDPFGPTGGHPLSDRYLAPEIVNPNPSDSNPPIAMLFSTDEAASEGVVASVGAIGPTASFPNVTPSAVRVSVGGANTPAGLAFPAEVPVEMPRGWPAGDALNQTRATAGANDGLFAAGQLSGNSNYVVTDIGGQTFFMGYKRGFPMLWDTGPSAGRAAPAVLRPRNVYTDQYEAGIAWDVASDGPNRAFVVGTYSGFDGEQELAVPHAFISVCSKVAGRFCCTPITRLEDYLRGTDGTGIQRLAVPSSTQFLSANSVKVVNDSLYIAGSARNGVYATPQAFALRIRFKPRQQCPAVQCS